MVEHHPRHRGQRTAVYALTPQGARLARTLADALPGDLFLPEALAAKHEARPFGGLIRAVSEAFHRYDRLVFVAATGIVVRAVAPHLRAKDLDPAVVTLDTEGRFAVSLLSGHLGGANALAAEVARITGGTPVITTATDTAGVPSWDLLAVERNLAIANLEAVKRLNMAVLKGEPVEVLDPEDRLGLGASDGPFAPGTLQRVKAGASGAQPSVVVTWKALEDEASPDRLILHPRCLVAGVGCNRGTAAREILELLETTLSAHGLAPASLSGLATIEAKRDEAGILKACEALGVAVTCFPAEDLRDVPVPNPSETVKRHMGVESVCEAAALKRAGRGRLLVPKVRSRNATLAIALEGSSSSA